MKKQIRSFACIIFLVATLVGRGADGIEWRYGFGIQDMFVPQADSQTWGVNVYFSAEQTLPSGIHWLAWSETMLDHDKDHLDPDHIPVWWRVRAEIDGPIARLSDSWQFSWVADLDTRANTVSSVEREMKAMPGLALGYKSGGFSAGLKAAAGWFFLEIDDDVAKEYGYGRDDFRNNEFAGTLAAEAAIELTPGWKLLASAQGWASSDTWLEVRYLGELRYAPSHWKKGGAVTLSVELNQINLDVYVPSALTAPYPPILPWDHDCLVKLSYSTRW